MTTRPCGSAACARPHYALGFCRLHYRRVRATGTTATPLAKMPFADRFWAQVAKGAGCWEWTGAINSVGYGILGKSGRSLSAHRASYSLNVGPIPEGMSICHHCDNRKCVRPDHLFLGTQLDNMRDRNAKGRANTPRGERVHSARLNERCVREIIDSSLPHRQIAELYGVHRATVSAIKTGKIWRHVQRHGGTVTA